MKKIKIISVIGLLMLTCSASVYAQQIDRQQMSQDINIMDGILGDLFKNVYSQSDYYNFGSQNKMVHGIYLPGYGVIFQITPHHSLIWTLSNKDRKNENNQNPITKEAVINKIVDFLGNYGPVIHQLNHEDNILVLFNGMDNSTGRVFNISGKSTSVLNLSQRHLVLSVAAKESDLKAYQRGDISKKDFRQRLSISTRKQDENKNRDLKIFAHILKTALKNKVPETFHISGDIDYRQIADFGALFSFSIKYGNGFQFSSSIHIAPPDSFLVFSNAKIEKDSLQHPVLIMKNMKLVTSRMKKYNRKVNLKRSKQTANMKDALHSFIEKLKKYVVDYGGTLHSISSDQYVMMPVNVDNDEVQGIPKKLALQVKKSVLAAAASGKISRQQAMGKIEIRKYQ
jgi:hypothetical protein